MVHHLLTIASYLIATFLLIAPLIFHEMGHWAALRRMGVPVVQYWLGLGPVLFRWGSVNVGMLPIGGAVVPEPVGYENLNGKQKLIVALAGPAASLLYGLIFWCLWLLNQQFIWAPALLQIAGLNFLITGLNLLPIPPLDGFQAWMALNEMKGTPLHSRTLRLAHKAGSGLVYGIGFMAVGAFLLRR